MTILSGLMCFLYICANGQFEISTAQDGSWHKWSFLSKSKRGTIETHVGEDWNLWEVQFNGKKGTISTVTRNDFEYWQIRYKGAQLDLYTTDRDYQHWKLENLSNNIYYQIKSTDKKSYSSWKTLGDKSCNIFALDNTLNSWEIKGDDISGERDILQIAFNFIPVFVSSVYVEEIE